MELKDFVLLFSSLCEDTDPSEITPETLFHELDDWSSLFSLSLTAQIKDETGVLLRNDEIKKARTVQDLYELVKK